MLKQQLIDTIKTGMRIETQQLSDIELIIKEYPFFETAHLIYTKGLHQHNSINYSKQLRKTAIVANSRAILYELLHQKEVNKPAVSIDKPKLPEAEIISAEKVIIEKSHEELQGNTSVTNNDIKVIYVSTTHVNTTNKEAEVINTADKEIDFVKQIENETDYSQQVFNETKLNTEIEAEIHKSIIQSYVATDIIKTNELDKEEVKEPTSFTDWLLKIKKEAGTIQPKEQVVPELKTEKKNLHFSQNKEILNKIIENEPGRIKLSTNKFFTPNIDAKQSLLENEHLVTETLAKIYALQGNTSKAIRAYEILSLKFPQKSVYFTTLIEKLKTNK